MSKEQNEELSDIFRALEDFLYLYEKLKNGSKYSTPEILKNVQNSIKELCTLIIQKTSN